ncbi:hypothetical protein KGP36_03350 [Patescibacteria group bacterium]|nr:hypothetical protein [Patescibacteria group bacterium]
MKVREYKESDLDRLKELYHNSGFDYYLPGMNEFFSKRVVDSPDGIAMAAFLKLNAEAYLICDPKWRNPAWRMEALRQLESVCREDAVEKGAMEAVSFIPPQLNKTFGRRLSKMGWSPCRPEWQCYFKVIQNG